MRVLQFYVNAKGHTPPTITHLQTVQPLSRNKGAQISLGVLVRIMCGTSPEKSVFKEL